MIDGLHFASGVTFGGFEWSGDFTTVDLIAASTNALNGALLARRPDHYKQFTIVGIILMAILGGLGGASLATSWSGRCHRLSPIRPTYSSLSPSASSDTSSPTPAASSSAKGSSNS